MAKKLFKPGQSGNPGGRPRDTQRFREIKKLTREQVEQLGALILSSNTQELQKIAQDPNSSVLQVWIASGSIQGIKKGDLNAMNALLDRIVGRMPAPLDVSISNESQSNILICHVNWADEDDKTNISQDEKKDAAADSD